MAQNLTTQQQIAALKKGIQLERHKYIYAIEQGEPNCVLEAIVHKLEKLAIILECVYSIDAESKKIITVREAEFVDNNKQKVAS